MTIFLLCSGRYSEFAIHAIFEIEAREHAEIFEKSIERDVNGMYSAGQLELLCHKYRLVDFIGECDWEQDTIVAVLTRVHLETLGFKQVTWDIL